MKRYLHPALWLFYALLSCYSGAQTDLSEIESRLRRPNNAFTPPSATTLTLDDNMVSKLYVYRSSDGGEVDYKAGHKLVFDSNAHDLAAGIELLRKAAAAGHVGALSDLGACYYIGRGVVRDPRYARDFLERAASGGDGHAQFILGTERGRGGIVSKDIIIAEDLLKKSASNGLAMAKVNLGALYLTEDFGSRSTAAEGRDLLQSIASGGEKTEATTAAKFLGLVYANGLRTPPNLKLAALWFGKAAANGDAESMYNLFIVSCNQPSAVSLSAGAGWLSRAAEAGLPNARTTLRQLLSSQESKASQKLLDDAERQKSEQVGNSQYTVFENPYYTEGKRLREKLTDKTSTTQDLARAAIVIGLGMIAEHYQSQQEEKQWVRGVQSNVYFDQSSGGLIFTNKPVDVLPNPYFPRVRPAR